MSEYEKLEKYLYNRYKNYRIKNFKSESNTKVVSIFISNYICICDFFESFKIQLTKHLYFEFLKSKNVLSYNTDTQFLIYFHNSHNYYFKMNLKAFSFDNHLYSKQNYVDTIVNKVNVENKNQEGIEYTFEFVEVKNDLTDFSKIFDLFIILLLKYIFLLSYNYFHNTNIVIFSNINFLISYTTFRHTLFK